MAHDFRFRPVALAAILLSIVTISPALAVASPSASDSAETERERKGKTRARAGEVLRGFRRQLVPRPGGSGGRHAVDEPVPAALGHPPQARIGRHRRDDGNGGQRMLLRFGPVALAAFFERDVGDNQRLQAGPVGPRLRAEHAMAGASAGDLGRYAVGDQGLPVGAYAGCDRIQLLRLVQRRAMPYTRSS